MLGGFVRAHMATLDEADLTALEALLDLPDPDLADWLTGRQPIPPEQDDPLHAPRLADAPSHPRGGCPMSP